ncbi:MAG: radical SAM protein [Calditerrivibrio sp.]|nr:radical SAM protein [Calditerrivibrio sp.]
MIYIEKSAEHGHFRKLFDENETPYEFIEDKSEIEDSKKNILITSQKNRFVHSCPATKEYRCCNYMVVDAVEGCPFDCSYCILQAYLNHNYIKVYDDMESIRESILDLSKKGKFRLGTGELSDSLALDHILRLLDFIIPIINKQENIQFEFKTKSSNISNLLNHNPKNIVVSFSLNPEIISKREELFASSPIERIKAAKTLTEYGYRVSFHFDPLIYCDNFEEEYINLLDYLFDNIEQSSVEFISISTFRFVPELADIIRNKFDNSDILANNFIKSMDNKMRYFKTLRVHMLKTVYYHIKKNWDTVFTYFCMEDRSIWEKIMNYDPGDRENFEKYFKWYRS